MLGYEYERNDDRWSAFKYDAISEIGKVEVEKKKEKLMTKEIDYNL